jgi:hypothetical protein
VWEIEEKLLIFKEMDHLSNMAHFQKYYLNPTFLIMIEKKVLPLLLISLLTALILLVSCSLSEDEENIIRADALYFSSDLKAAKHSFKEQARLMNPGDIINVDDRFLVISDAEEDAIFKIFSLPELEFLYSWGNRGQGPDEFQYVPLNEINTSENILIIYDISSQMLAYYLVNDTTFTYEGNRSLTYEGQTNILSHVTRLNDSLFVADYGTFKDTNYEHIALQPGVDIPLTKFGNYPHSEFEGPERYFEFIKTIGSSEDVSKIAAFYLRHNRFKLYDFEGKELANVYVADDYNSEVNNSNPGSFRYRMIQWASDRYLYVMGIHENPDVIEENADAYTPSLEVWNWEGEQIYRAKFDSPIHNFTVSEEHGKIYAYSNYDMDNIFVFEIPAEIHIK